MRLDEEAFLYGCVKPDVTSLFVRHPHFWKLSKKFVCKRIVKICRRSPKQGKAHRHFSEELGVILHYVADFFTAVHNLSPNPIRAHIEFERVLHEGFLEQATPATVAGYFNFRNPLTIDADGLSAEIAQGINREIARRHARYAPDRGNPGGDIQGIVGACAFVAAAIMDAVRVNIDAAILRPAPLPETAQGRVLQGSVPDIADFR